MKSDNVIIKDANTLFIPNFYYDGEAPAAYFFVGKGSRTDPKTKALVENGR